MNAPPTKRVRLSYDKHISVLVGAEEHSFVAYEGIITSHSKFFSAACTGGFKEAEERVVRLPEEDIVMFRSYLHWIYTGEVVVPSSTAPPGETAEEVGHIEWTADRICDTYDDLAHFFTLADRLDDLELRNAVIDAMLKLKAEAHANPTEGVVELAYQQTAESSTLRKFILDCFCAFLDVGWFKHHRHMLPHDFVFGLACTRAEETEAPCWENRCKYHEHPEGVPKCV